MPPSFDVFSVETGNCAGTKTLNHFFSFYKLKAVGQCCKR